MGFYINNPEVRRFDLQAQGSIPSRQLNQARLEAILGRTVSVYEDNSKEAVELYRVVLELLGIKAGLAFEEDGRVRVAINSMSEAEHLVEGFIGANRFPESIRKSQL